MDDRTGARRGRCESLDLVRWLLDRGADPRLRDARGLENPADLARRELRTAPAGHPRRGFYEEAIQMLEEAAKRIEENGELAEIVTITAPSLPSLLSLFSLTLPILPLESRQLTS